MQLTLTTLAFLIAAANGSPALQDRAVDAAVGSTNALAPLVTIELTYCKDKNFVTCRTVAATIGTCHNLLPEWDNTASSVRPQQGGGPICRLFKDTSCGTAGGFIDVLYPGLADMNAVLFNDVLSSYRCT